MKIGQIKQGGIYKNHDPKVAERQVTSIHSNGKQDKEVWFIDAKTLKPGISTVSQMAEWATEMVGMEGSKAA